MIVKASELGAHTWGLEENFCVKAEQALTHGFSLKRSQALLLGFSEDVVNCHLGEYVPGVLLVHRDLLEVV